MEHDLNVVVGHGKFKGMGVFGATSIVLEERKANCRLASAAPDLLEALLYAVRFLKPEEHDVEFVNAAIRKAVEER